MKYYNSGTSLGVVRVRSEDIKHSDGDFTFIVSGAQNWIRSTDLKDTYDEAANSSPAKFLFP